MTRLARMAIAIVWLYNGLWCKLLAGCPDHKAIVASIAGPLGLPEMIPILAIGTGEVGLALWVMSGLKPWHAAWVQTVVLLTMNAAGLIWGSSEIPNWGGLLVHNLVFLTLIWIVAQRPAVESPRES